MPAEGRHLRFLIQNATQAGFAGTLNTVNSFGLPKDYPETFQRQISQPSAEAVKTGAEMLLGSENSVVSIKCLSGKPIPEPK